ncbi:MAG TPA: hypothetical protein VIB62_00110 [Actinomycetota bacterium]|jgi:hypothetical protein
MGARRTDGDEPLDLGTPVAEEPEPDWAEEIRRLRKERGDRLKALLDEDEPGSPAQDPK